MTLISPVGSHSVPAPSPFDVAPSSRSAPATRGALPDRHPPRRNQATLYLHSARFGSKFSTSMASSARRQGADAKSAASRTSSAVAAGFELVASLGVASRAPSSPSPFARACAMFSRDAKAFAGPGIGLIARGEAKSGDTRTVAAVVIELARRATRTAANRPPRNDAERRRRLFLKCTFLTSML